MSAKKDAAARMAADLEAFEERHTRPFSSEARNEFYVMLVQFADDLICAADEDDEEVDADCFDELMECIAAVQSQVIETARA